MTPRTWLGAIVLLVTAALGLVVGLLLRPSPAPGKEPQGAAKNGVDGASTSADYQADVGEQRTPQETPQVTPADDASGNKDWDAIAQEAFNLAMDIRQGRNPYNKMQAAEVYGRLNEKTAPWFVKKYREAIEAMKTNDGSNPTLASKRVTEIGEVVQLLAMSGGQEVADLFLERLKAPDRYGVETGNFSLLFGGSSGWPSLDRIPMSPAYQEVGLMLANSGNYDDTRTGLAILGWFNAPESRAALTSALQTNPEIVLQMAAVKGLGRIGDSSTLAVLRAKALLTPVEGELNKRLIQLLKDAIAQLEKRLGTVK